MRERLGEALFRLVAGPEGESARARIHGTPGPRWFAPDSAVVRVHGDASMFIGGIRAVMLQSLHPAAMTAVAEHSGYRGDLWGRLARTSTFLATTTFGAEKDAQRAVDIVRAVHKRVTGTLPDGTPYAASDPHLLAWVHVAEIESFLVAHQIYGQAPLDQEGRDAYVAEAALVARKLGVLDPPTSEAELRAVLGDFRPELRATTQAREALAYVIHEPPLSAAARPAYRVLCAAAIALMPEWSRSPLDLPHRPRLERGPVRLGGRAATTGIRWMMAPGHQTARRLQVTAGEQ